MWHFRTHRFDSVVEPDSVGSLDLFSNRPSKTIKSIISLRRAGCSIWSDKKKYLAPFCIKKIQNFEFFVISIPGPNLVPSNPQTVIIYREQTWVRFRSF
jgi:hypothetical protein